jgi:hypothetical protein
LNSWLNCSHNRDAPNQSDGIVFSGSTHVSNAVPIFRRLLSRGNGNSIPITSMLTGIKLGRPTPIYLTDANGNALTLSGFTLGTLQGAPTPAVLTDISREHHQCNRSDLGRTHYGGLIVEGVMWRKAELQVYRVSLSI